MEDPNAGNIFKHYKQYFRPNLTDIERGRTKLMIPIVPQAVMINICEQVGQLFAEEPMLLRLDVPTVVVGDLHGHLLDLFRTLGKVGLPPDRTYLFLGDIVDRGEFSTETVTLILVMKLLFPQNIYVIRGNHEFYEMAHHCGFSAELMSLYSNDAVETAFYKCFSYIPIGALIGTQVLCVHGGIGPSVTKISQLEDIPRPLESYNEEIVMSLLWSDPSRFLNDFEPSTRGLGYFFGADALKKFMEHEKLKLVIRGHECVENGIEMQLERHMMTVFGASNYCGLSPNKSGVAIFNPDATKEIIIFQALQYVKRATVTFLQSESDTVFMLRKPLSTPCINGRSKRLPMLTQPQVKPKNDPHKKGKVPEVHSGRLRIESELRGARGNISNVHSFVAPKPRGSPLYQKR